MVDQHQQGRLRLKKLGLLPSSAPSVPITEGADKFVPFIMPGQSMPVRHGDDFECTTTLIEPSSFALRGEE